MRMELAAEWAGSYAGRPNKQPQESRSVETFVTKHTLNISYSTGTYKHEIE